MPTATESDSRRGSGLPQQDDGFPFFRYLLALSEVADRPEPMPGLRAGDLRRGANGTFWIFDGESWIEW